MVSYSVKMHVKVCLVVVLGVVAVAHAAKIETAMPKADAKPAVALEERSDKTPPINARDGRGNAYDDDEGGLRGGDHGGNDEYFDNGKQGDKSGDRDGWKDDGVKKVEIVEYEDNNGKHHGGGGGGGYRNKERDSDWKGDSKIEIVTSGGGGGGGGGGGDHGWADDKKSEYVSSGSHRVPVYGKEEKHEKNEKNEYEKKEEPKSEYGKEHQVSGLAEVIPAYQTSLTLDQIYRVQKKQDGAYGGGGGSNQYQSPNSQQQILLMLKFGRDFSSWDPRNNNSMWQWCGIEAGRPADNAAFVVHTGNEGGYGAEKWQADKGYGPKKDNSYVVQYSLPYKNLVNGSELLSLLDTYEGVVETKTKFSIEPTQRFLVRIKLACKVINADRNPFPASAVANVLDDFRFGCCGYEVIDSGDSGLHFSFSITNTGVWAGYQRNPSSNSNSTAQTFSAWRRVGRRPRYDTLVDAAIEIDRRQGTCSYYLNGYRVWSIYAIGVLPPDDGVTSISRGQGEPQVTTVVGVKVNFGTYKFLDLVDPNNPGSRLRLVQVRGNSLFYGLNDTFFDPLNLKTSQLFGQGAILTLLKLLILKAESVIISLQPLLSAIGV